MLELEPLIEAPGARADRRPKQKISLGRGLVREDVAAILFDEPLTVIDPHLKWMLRRKLKQIHEQFRLTLIYVTHDQIEALTFADQVVVMYEGEVVQLGTPQELFERAGPHLRRLLHRQPGHELPALPARRRRRAASRAPTPSLGAHWAKAARARRPSAELELGIRPEFVRCAGGADETGAAGRDRARSRIWATTRSSPRGSAPHLLKAKLPEDEQPPAAVGPAGCSRRARTLLYADGRLIG